MWSHFNITFTYEKGLARSDQLKWLLLYWTKSPVAEIGDLISGPSYSGKWTSRLQIHGRLDPDCQVQRLHRCWIWTILDIRSGQYWIILEIKTGIYWIAHERFPKTVQILYFLTTFPKILQIKLFEILNIVFFKIGFYFDAKYCWLVLKQLLTN